MPHSGSQLHCSRPSAHLLFPLPLPTVSLPFLHHHSAETNSVVTNDNLTPIVFSADLS